MTVILSDETVKQLLEAHASMAAWYYQMAEVLRNANMGVHPPNAQQRLAYIKQLGQTFPELAGVTSTLNAPRPYVPPPAFSEPFDVTENEGVSTPAPPADLVETPAMIRSAEPEPAPQAAAPEQPPAEQPSPGAAAQPDAPAAPPPPAIVDPNKVKYD